MNAVEIVLGKIEEKRRLKRVDQTRPKKFVEGGVCMRERADDTPLLLRPKRIAETLSGN